MNCYMLMAEKYIDMLLNKIEIDVIIIDVIPIIDEI
jgi:hypothetical protein